MTRRKANIIQYLKLERPFVGLPDDTIISEELNKLTPHARWLYVVLLSKFNRKKDSVKKWYNFTYEELVEITHYDERTITRAIRQLETSDFIEVQHGGKNNPSQYRPVLRWLY